MNTIKFLFAIAVLSFTSCGDDHDHGDGDTDFKYHAHIISPNADNKKVNDMIDIEVMFESHSGETVHHVNVALYEDGNAENVIFSGPDEAHVHASEGNYTFKHSLALSDDKVAAHTNWILEAKVWGHEAGAGEVIETLVFHVHPE